MFADSARNFTGRMVRAAILIDLENVVGTTRLRPSSRASPYRSSGRSSEQIVEPVWAITVCHDRLAPQVVLDAHRCGVRVRPGRGGKNWADRQLVDRATTDLPHGIEAVVLVSGDSDFVPTVWQQQSRGRDVIVVSRKEALSAELAAAADDVRYLNDLELVA